MSAPARETRVVANDQAELRAVGEPGKFTQIAGYAARYDVLSLDLGGFREKIRPGAFSKVLKTCDCRALFNHDPNWILGRNLAGTLRLTEDAMGLHFDNDIAPTERDQGLALSIDRRDVSGCSFAFTVAVDEWDYSGQTIIRTIVEIEDLFDVGPVVYPAYPDTTVAVRSLEASRPEPSISERVRASLRLRLAEAD